MGRRQMHDLLAALYWSRKYVRKLKGDPTGSDARINGEERT